jgi:hypothetical protein
MTEQLRRQIASPELLKRLEEIAGDAPAAAPLSLRIELGKFDMDWLHLLPDCSTFWFRARPREQEFRLGIGQALHVSSAAATVLLPLTTPLPDSANSGAARHSRSLLPALLSTHATTPRSRTRY